MTSECNCENLSDASHSESSKPLNVVSIREHTTLVYESVCLLTNGEWFIDNAKSLIEERQATN